MCHACEQHDQTLFGCVDAPEITAMARNALKSMFHFPSVLSAAELAQPAEREALAAMIFSALGIARFDERMEMVQERTVLADSAIAKTYFFPATRSRLAVAKGSRNSFFVLDFSFEWPASSRREMIELEQWLKGF